MLFFFSSRRRHTRSVSAFLLNRSSDLAGIKSAIQGSNVPNPDEAVPSFVSGAMAKAGKGLLEGTLQAGTSAVSDRSEERFSRNAETDLVCRLLLEKKKNKQKTQSGRVQ